MSKDPLDRELPPRVGASFSTVGSTMSGPSKEDVAFVNALAQAHVAYERSNGGSFERWLLRPTCGQSIGRAWAFTTVNAAAHERAAVYCYHPKPGCMVRGASGKLAAPGSPDALAADAAYFTAKCAPGTVFWPIS